MPCSGSAAWRMLGAAVVMVLLGAGLGVGVGAFLWRNLDCGNSGDQFQDMVCFGSGLSVAGIAGIGAPFAGALASAPSGADGRSRVVVGVVGLAAAVVAFAAVGLLV